MKRNSDNIITIFLVTSIVFIITVASILFIKIYNDYSRETVEIQTFYSEEDIAEESDIEEFTINSNIVDEYTEEYYSNTQENSFYYNQLDEYAKQIYIQLFNNIDNLKLGNYTIDYGSIFNGLLNSQNGEEILENAYNSAIQAFMYDNPQVFYIDFQKMYLQTTYYVQGSKTKYEVSLRSEENDNYYLQEFTNKEQIDSEISRIEEVRDNIISMCSGKSTYEKIKYVHDWFVDNMKYDRTLEKSNIHNIYGALIKKEVVCDGYSNAFKYILDFMDIPCILVCGIGVNSEEKSENHAWNYVKMGENWYAVDVTWDNPIIIGGGTLTNVEKYKYFLKGERNFSYDHIANVDGMINFEVPTLNYEDF